MTHLQADVAELIRRSREGDRASFDVLVRQHYSLAYNVAFRMLRDPDLACDATQAAFVRAYRAMPRFRQDATFSTWLYRIVTNVCLDQLRHQDRTVNSLTVQDEDDQGSLEEMEIPDERSDPAAAAEQRERQSLVQTALGRLQADHRAVLIMFDLNGLSYEEISETLGVPLGTVKSRLNRARHALKEALGSHLELFR
ncbi:MAG: sigma-70 family RNA polymerase sigma factor [Armatimonadia bacterium]